MGFQRGRLTLSDECKQLQALVTEAQAAGARQAKACELLGFSAKTLQRWSQPNQTQDGRIDAIKTPANRLTDFERQRIIQVVNSADLNA
ncbi:hypothetical protein [Algibacillus agarilyticus]|uniref:hypothetical protein n=1 Tax=Algibacillus agarilyticus TaxID=2234133 RepID=UPI00130038E9|nr:hypothetical protein [Algibacillus agarilyticus]